jgi:hypothetical protein
LATIEGIDKLKPLCCWAVIKVQRTRLAISINLSFSVQNDVTNATINNNPVHIKQSLVKTPRVRELDHRTQTEGEKLKYN